MISDTRIVMVSSRMVDSVDWIRDFATKHLAILKFTEAQPMVHLCFTPPIANDITKVIQRLFQSMGMFLMQLLQHFHTIHYFYLYYGVDSNNLSLHIIRGATRWINVPHHRQLQTTRSHRRKQQLCLFRGISN